MTVEVALLISIVSVVAAIFFGMAAFRRNQRTDDRSEQDSMTRVIVKLESINADTNEIKNDIKSVKADGRQNSEQIIRVDESLKSAWKQINEINAHIKRGE